MLFLVRISIEAIVFGLLLPSFWAGIALLAAAIFAIRSRRAGGRTFTRATWLSELAVLALAPLGMLAMAYAIWPDNLAGRSPHEALGLNLLYAFAAVQVAVTGALLWRHRARLVATAIAGAIALLWTAGAVFTSSMAITNTWL